MGSAFLEVQLHGGVYRELSDLIKDRVGLLSIWEIKIKARIFFFLKETQKYTNWLNAGMERVLKKYWVCVGVWVCVVSQWKRVYACASVCCKPGRGVEVLDIRNWRPGLSHNRDMCSTVKDEPHTTWKSASVTLLERSSRVWLSVTTWTIARQAALSMGIFQARRLEWVAVPLCKRPSRPRDGVHLGTIKTLARPPWNQKTKE